MIPNSFSEAETEAKRKLPSSSSSSEKLEEKDDETERIPLTVLSLNMEFYHQYQNANDKPAYEQYLKRKVDSVMCCASKKICGSVATRFWNPPSHSMVFGASCPVLNSKPPTIYCERKTVIFWTTTTVLRQRWGTQFTWRVSYWTTKMMIIIIIMVVGPW